MSKLLKLTGIKTWVGPMTGGVLVTKNQVVRVNDAAAMQMEKGSRRNNEGEDVPYWTEPLQSDNIVHHDFTSGAEKKAAQEAVAEPTAAPAPTRAPARQRRAAA